MICPHCRTRFVPAPWPSTHQRYCSSTCSRRAWYERNVEQHAERTKEWCRTHRPRRLEIQRRWNATPEAIAQKRAWQRAHYKAWYAQMKATGGLRVVYARVTSLRRLKRHNPLKQCVCPPPHRGRIECHHRDGDPFNTALENLEWQCHAHHQQAHGRSRPPLPDVAARALRHQERRSPRRTES